jgi:trimeric autotransporter adhesin
MMEARKSLAGPWVVAAVCGMVLAACSSPTGSTAGGGAGAAGGSGEIEVEDASASPDRKLSNGDTVDFGSVDVGGGWTQRDFTITNTGSDDLSLTGSPRVVIDEPGIDDNFTLISAPSTDTLQPGEEATFTIQFSPMSPDPGTFSATATIPSSDGDENPFVINLDGESIFVPIPGPI